MARDTWEREERQTAVKIWIAFTGQEARVVLGVFASKEQAETARYESGLHWAAASIEEYDVSFGPVEYEDVAKFKPELDSRFGPITPPSAPGP